MLSDDKISHLSHILLKGLKKENIVTTKSEDSNIRREIKKTITNQLEIGEGINSKVKEKLRSYSRKIIEGSPEWEVLYHKFYKEEERKIGIDGSR